MAKWSVALFGHNKHRYELREIGATLTQMSMGENYLGIMQYKKEMINRRISCHTEKPIDFASDKLYVYNVTGWERRAIPGDIIGIKPEKNWNVDDQADVDSILIMIRDREWLLSKKEEVWGRFKAAKPAGPLERSLKSGEAIQEFERFWVDILKHGIRNPEFLPEPAYSLFSFSHGASMWHLYGDSVWTENERRRFLIVKMTGFENDQVSGMKEVEHDLSSYVPYFDPKDFDAFKALLKKKANESVDRKKALAALNRPGFLDGKYKEYVEMWPHGFFLPKRHWKKRRFAVPLDSLSALGINVDRMLDMNDSYVPEIGEIGREHVWDKLRQRSVSEMDRFQMIQRLTINELKNPKTAEEVLSELRGQ